MKHKETQETTEKPNRKEIKTENYNSKWIEISHTPHTERPWSAPEIYLHLYA